MSVKSFARQVLMAVLFCSIPVTCFASIATTIGWDVRTTGSDANGGGFDKAVTSPGTDYSQQDTAQFAFTDLVIGGTTTQLTSAAHPFSSASPGNIIHITGGSGCTTGWYEINSVSSVTATMDRSVGTAASTCTGNMGGSMLTMQGVLNTQANNGFIYHIWLKSGTYTLTSTVIPGSWSTYFITGYGSTHGDGGTKPLVTTATNSIVLFQNGTANNQSISLENLAMTSTAATKTDAVLMTNGGTFLTVDNCTFSGFKTTISVNTGAVDIQLNNVYISSDTASGVNAAAVYIDRSAMASLTNVYITGTTGDAVQVAQSFSTETVTIEGSILVGNGGYGVNFSGNQIARAIIINSTIAGNTSGGVAWPTTSPSGTNFYSFNLILQSNIIYGNGGYGLNIAPSIVLDQLNLGHNAWGSNTSGNYTSNVPAGTGDVTLTATPFTNSGSGDYSLNSTAGGGAAAKGVGYPGVFPGGLTTGHRDIGAVQSAGGSSATIGTASVQ